MPEYLDDSVGDDDPVPAFDVIVYSLNPGDTGGRDRNLVEVSLLYVAIGDPGGTPCSNSAGVTYSAARLQR